MKIMVTVTRTKDVKCYPATLTLKSEHDYNCRYRERIASLRGGE